MPNYNVIPLQFRPGIQRDGTPYNAKACIDGQWVRWTLQEGSLPAVPNKIGGYKIIDNGDGDIIRTLYDVPASNSVDTYMGRADSLKYQHFNFDGLGTGEVDRTPGTGPGPDGFHPDPNNLWDFDLFANADDPQDPLIVAHVAPNASDISNTITGPIFFGDTVGTDQNRPLAQIFDNSMPDPKPVMASGGILYSAPIMIAYGNNGFIQWSNPGVITPWTTTNTQFIANTKIVYMTNYRGILAWTLNSLINLVYIPTNIPPAEIAFETTTIDSNITVMSPRSIVSYRQQFFWIGNDQFYFFNGVVQRLKNTMQTDWFFKNINRAATAKVWGMVIPGQREIWWFYPRGNATECTNVIIYNEELQCWYDSEIGRAAGLSPTVFPFPKMSDNQPLNIITRTGPITTFPLWMHEFGYDKVINPSNISSVDSFYETPIIDLFEDDPKNNRLIRSRRIEPDFLQNGNMTVTINNRMFASDTVANGNVIQSGPYTFDDNTQKVDDINSQGRLVSFVFRSNEIGGAYEMGKTLLGFNIGDVQP